MREKTNHTKTDWESVSEWYDREVCHEGHFYHQEVIFPKLLPLLDLPPAPTALLDLACGQGVLSRQLPSHIEYVGVDLSASLIDAAKRRSPPHHRFFKGDVTRPLSFLAPQSFARITCILALQNIASLDGLLRNVRELLVHDGKCAIVMNHPCFRIPRQSSWGIDASKKLQYRRLDRYMSPMEIPISAHPSQGKESAQTLSFHLPLSAYAHAFQQHGLVIETMCEWCSPRTSSGPKARMENRAREEFPLFLVFLLHKPG